MRMNLPSTSLFNLLQSKMDEELLKRNTDCVYFLASPLTCKKGGECDFRHSEMARLNLRDCWYWLSGNCLNPTCGFRHPPLEIHAKAQAPAEVESMVSISCFPSSKKNVPCYFYFNGYCNKGDNCTFVHGPEDVASSNQKDHAVVEGPPIDDRISPASTDKLLLTKMSNAKLPARTELMLDAPEKFSGVLRRIQKVASEDLSVQKRKREMYEEASITKSDSIYESDHVIKIEPSLSSDHFSEGNIDSGIQDEWWESSPEFDVVLNKRTEGIEAEDDREHMLGCHSNDEEHEIFMDCCYGDQKSYSGRFSQERTRRRVNEPGCYGVDLRDHLTKRRSLDLDGRLERRSRMLRFIGRLEPKLERNSFYNQRHRAWNRQLSKITGRHSDRLKRKSNSLCTRGKTLARMQARKHKTNEDLIGYSCQSDSVNFEGPKPLSVILNDKKQTNDATSSA